MQLLIIDNSIQIVHRLKEFLSESTRVSELFSATGYNEALQLFMQERPAIVVLDHHLPDNKSYQLLREIKQAEPSTVVIMMSAENDTYTQQQFILLGADFYFDKYNEFEKVTVVVNDHTTKKGGIQQ